MGLLSQTRASGASRPRTPGVSVAIYSLHHSSVGRSTHAPGTAGAHVGYITRAGSQAEVIAERMPLAALGRSGGQARAWLDEQEAGDRKNGRVIDKVMVAIPRELSAEQQLDLVRGFAEEVTLGRAPWLAAVHRDHPENPHAHIVIRDKDPETGKRVAGLSEKGSTDRLREAWERHANLALERAGQEARIDRRSLKDQGVDREPTIHVGPQANAIERQGKELPSQVRLDRRGREIRYPDIDRGTSRARHNGEIIRRNARRIWEQESAAIKKRLEQAKEALKLDERRERAARYATMSLDALRGLYEGEVARIAKVIVARAEALRAKLYDLRMTTSQRLHQVEGQEPVKPKFLGMDRWAKEKAAWEAEKAHLARRASHLRRREETLKGFNRSNAGTPLSMYPTRADQRAEADVGRQDPELVTALSAARARQHAQDRTRTRTIERQPRGRDRDPGRSR